MRKRDAVWSAAVALGLAAVLYGCPDKDVLEDLLKPPTVAVADVHISGLSAESLNLIIDVDITNPNPIALTLARIEYRLEVAGRELAAGSVDSPVSIKASGVSRASAPVRVAYNEIKTIYALNQTADYVDYTLAGTAYVRTPVGDLPLPYRKSGKLPVARPPKVVSVGIKVDELSLAGAAVTVRFQLENPNGYPLELKTFSYRLSLEGRDFAAGRITDQKIMPRNMGLIDAPVTIDFQSGLSWALSLLTKQRAGYALDFEAEYLIDDYPVRQSESSAGRIDFSR